MGEQGSSGIRSEAVLAVLLIFSIVLLLFTGTLKDKDSAVRFLGGFIQGAQRIAGEGSARIKDGFGSLRRLREMRVQYEAALQQLSTYEGMERSLVELRRENAELKKLLGFSAGTEFEHIPGRVIAGDPSNLFSTIVIDLGTYDGIRSGMVVSAFQDGFFGLVGKVVSVAAHTAQVRPIVAPDNYVAARLQRGRFEGLVSGRGNEKGQLVMRYVRKSAGNMVGINDLVVTSGMQSIYPSGIFIGRVAEVRTQEYSTSMDLILNPVIDITKTEYVFVLKESGEQL